MSEDFKELLEKFIKINKEGYIKGVNNTTNSCGLTFEKLIGKDADSKYAPDYKSVEIKTTQRYSRYAINLFSLVFDGPKRNEGNYLLESYGFFEKEYNRKSLTLNLKYNEKVSFHDEYYFELKINYRKKRLEIVIYDHNLKKLETRGYIKFKSIKTRLDIKLKNMALVFASKKTSGLIPLFRYYKIIFYKLRDFDTFLKLIELGDIETVLMLRFAKSGLFKGANKNKNIVFRIKKDKVDSLFEEIYRFED